MANIRNGFGYEYAAMSEALHGGRAEGCGWLRWWFGFET
jgi:hypothetical protein